MYILKGFNMQTLSVRKVYIHHPSKKNYKLNSGYLK